MTLIMMFRLELVTAFSYMRAFPEFYITHGILALIQNGISFGDNLVVCGSDSSMDERKPAPRRKLWEMANWFDDVFSNEGERDCIN